MNISTIRNAITSRASRQVLIGQKHSPTILFAAGVVGVIATVVLASRATLYMDEVLEDTQDKLDSAKGLHDKDLANYTERDYKQDVAVLYVRSAVNIAKLYGPALVVGVVSIGALSGSHVILTRRNIGLTAAYAAIEKGFAEYRERVLSEVGPDKEREFRYGSEEISEAQVDNKGITKLLAVKRVGPNGASIYARFFDEFSPSWQREPEYNRIFLQCQQNWANDKLQARGHITLNEVYDALGIERSQAGFVVGWVLARDGVGDNFVDFGIFNGNDSLVRAFVNGREGAILLDFNVDGIIYDKI